MANKSEKVCRFVSLNYDLKLLIGHIAFSIVESTTGVVFALYRVPVRLIYNFITKMNSTDLQRARALLKSNQWLELITVCEQIMKANPSQLEARYMMGIALIQTQNINSGIEQLAELLNINPNDVNVLNAIAIGFEKMQQFEQALNYYQKALELIPNSVPLLTNIADLQRKMGNLEQAINQLKSILKTQPSDINILNNLALAFSDLKDVEQAKKYWKHALTIQPENPQIINNLSILLYKNHEITKALLYAEKAHKLAPNHPAILNNYGNCLAANNQPQMAIPIFIQAIELVPRFVEAIQNLAYAYHNIGDFNSASKYYALALQIDPNNKYPIWQRSMTNLLSGNFKQGWQDYEMGLELNERLSKKSSRLQWHPAMPKDSRVLVTLEQGVGDQIMFASCLPDLITKTSQITLECDPRLAPLFKRSFPAITVLPQADPTILTEYQENEGIEFQITFGSLPHFFRNKLSDFPREKSFLKPDLAAVEKWNDRFENLGKGKLIGISWNAGILVEHVKRSIPFEKWLSILKTPDCHFVNLQAGKQADCKEFKWLEDNHGIKIHEWDDSDSYKNLDDFAAKISTLDLVISVGNANVHLAGALGTPTWCLIPYVPSWRWMFNGTESVWYQSITIYRQNLLNQWDSVINKVEHDLCQLIKNNTIFTPTAI